MTITRTNSSAEQHLLTDVLRGVSRAFYLTLRVLPRGIREPVGVAYLLARAADTIADTQALPPNERLRHLLAFRAQVEHGASVDVLHTIEDSVVGQRVLRGERLLLLSLTRLFAMYEDLPPRDRGAVQRIVGTLCEGMESDLLTFPPEGSGDIGALRSDEELERYIWYVAGCVGDFWTRITVAHTPALAHWDLEEMSSIGIRFGKALQLVNVLRDLPRDLCNGRCYLPADALAEAGLTPRDLLDPRSHSRLRPVLRRWSERALDLFQSAEQYVLIIPPHCTRLRLAALWPLLIGLKTLVLLQRTDSLELLAGQGQGRQDVGRAIEEGGTSLPGEALPPAKDAARRVKVSRAWIYGMLVLSVPASLSNTALRYWFAYLRRQIAWEPLRRKGG